MKAYRTFLITGAVLIGGFVMSPSAVAQKAGLGLSQKVQVASAAATAAKAKASLESNRWACASERSYEIAPASSDVEAGGGFVLVHLRNGEPVSSERITASEAAALKKMGCQNERLDGADGPFVGG